MKRFLALNVAPPLLLLVLAAAPLFLGTGTLYMRDIFSGHYAMKVAQAEALATGEIPLIDPLRGGGQPSMGNPNSLPLYPTNLLYLLASPLWAMNAHFWIHWLLAPLAMTWLGRAWGLSRTASWAAGVCYGVCGFFLSLLNLYNLVAGATLAPAFVAALLTSLRPDPRRTSRAAIAGALWALLLLAGDPMFAALALGLGALACLFHPEIGADSRRSLRPAMALGLGTLVAAPMLVELLRILPLSFRGYWKFSIGAALSQSWDPRSVVEWWIPFFFGQPDFAFWGQSFYGGNPPLLYSVYPGVLCWALVATSGRPEFGSGWRNGRAWAWTLVALGLFVALGAYNPVVRALYGLPGTSMLRYPVKMWLCVAMGAALLCGFGVDRLRARGGPRRLAWALGIQALGFAALWLALTLRLPALHDLAESLDPQRLTAGLLDWQWLRWSGLCLLTLGVLALYGACLVLLRRHPRLGIGLLLTSHTATQLFFLGPLYHADDIAPYVARPPVLEKVPAEARVVHGGFGQLFGTVSANVLEIFPDPRFFWLTRDHFAQLHPFSGAQWGRRYELNHSPEGLDSFYVVSLAEAMQKMPDLSRIRILEASGVDILLLFRPLSSEAAAFTRLEGTYPAAGHELYAYSLSRRAPEAFLAGTVFPASHMGAALEHLTDPGFDPVHMAVVPGEEGFEGPPGEVEILSSGIEHLEADVRSAAGGLFVVQRAFLGIYRATVDGEPAELTPANLHRIGIEVPAGEHRVRIWIDRWPFRLSAGLALLAAAGLLALGISCERREASEEAPRAEP